MEMPAVNVSKIISVDIKLKGVKSLSWRVKIASWLLTLTSKMLHGNGCEIEVTTKHAQQLKSELRTQDVRLQLSYWLQRLEDISASKINRYDNTVAKRRYAIEETKNEIYRLMSYDNACNQSRQ